MARRAGLGTATVARIEVSDGIPSTKAATLHAIQMALEGGGVAFIDGGQSSPGGGPGVRMKGIGRPTR